MDNNDYGDSEVIDINAEDIEDNLDNILENSNTFRKNANIDVIRCIIFYVDGKNVISYKNNVKVGIDIFSGTFVSKCEFLR